MSSKQIKYGAIVSYLTLLFSTVATLVYIPWMVSKIGKANYGLYTLAITFISLFMMDFGLSAAVSRFIAKYNAEGNEEKVNVFLGTVEKLYIIIDLILLVVLTIIYFFLGKIYHGLTQYELTVYKQLYIIVAIYSVLSFPCTPLSGVLNAYELFIEVKLCDLIQKILIIALTVILLALGGDVKAVVMATAISGIVTIVIRVIIVKTKTRTSLINVRWDKSIVHEIISFSIWITVISIAQRCIFNLAPSILGVVSNTEEIALFAPANTLESFFFTLAAAVNGLFLPTVSRFVASKDFNEINRLSIKVGRFQVILLGLVVVGFVCVGKEFVCLWMGSDYSKTYYCAILLFIPDLLLFSQQIGNTTAIAMNFVKEQSIGYIGMAVICVILSLLLAPSLGALGSCISISVAYGFLFFYMCWLYEKKIHFDIKSFFRECYISLGVPILVALLMALFITGFIKISNPVLQILLKSVLTVGLYFFCISFRLTDTEKNVIKNSVTKIVRRKM